MPSLLSSSLHQVKKAFQGRVTLPGYQDSRLNASLALSGLRSSDSGLYRCEVVVGLSDEQDTVPLDVTGTLAGPSGATAGSEEESASLGAHPPLSA